MSFASCDESDMVSKRVLTQLTSSALFRTAKGLGEIPAKLVVSQVQADKGGQVGEPFGQGTTQIVLMQVQVFELGAIEETIRKGSCQLVLAHVQCDKVHKGGHLLREGAEQVGGRPIDGCNGVVDAFDTGPCARVGRHVGHPHRSSVCGAIQDGRRVALTNVIGVIQLQ